MIIRLATSIFLLILSINLYSQNYDTVEVSTTNTTYIVMKDNIIFSEIGLLDDYIGQVEGNILLIKCVNEEAKISTLLIKTESGEIKFFNLKYAKDPKQYFYNYEKKIVQKENKSNENIEEIEEDPEKFKVEDIKTNLEKLRERKENVFDCGIIADKIFVSVNSVFNDRTHYYIKIVIENQSTVDYQIDVVNFRYIEVYGKGFMKKDKENAEDLFPTVQIEGDKVVKGKSSTEFYYAIPIFALDKEDYIDIKIREYNGTRKISLKVLSNILNKSDKI